MGCDFEFNQSLAALLFENNGHDQRLIGMFRPNPRRQCLLVMSQFNVEQV